MRRRLSTAALFVMALSVSASCLGQGNNPPGQGGILIDAQGVVSAAPGLKRTEVLSRTKLEAAVSKDLPAELNRDSALRMVSLPALERECQRRLTAGQKLGDDILHLAGLQRIDYVFVYPDSKDLVIAGPAAGFAPNALKVNVGVNTGRPVLRLDDLLLALRSSTDTIGCSIDPVQERLANVNRYLQSVGAASSVSAARARYQTMVEILGQQSVRVWGVPADSHFAHVLVEADFRMKLLSIGKERSRVRGFKSYLALKEAGTNTMRRWWFAPFYQPLDRTEDRTAWRLNGQRVQLLAQDELVTDDGRRSAAAVQQVSTQKFARQFTSKYTDVAERSSVFAELQNLFDVSVVAALIRSEGLAAKVGWTMEFFRDPASVPVPKYQVPKMVPSLANSRKAGRLLVVGVVAGGVKIRPEFVVRSMRMNLDPGLSEFLAAGERAKAEASKAGRAKDESGDKAAPAAGAASPPQQAAAGERWWWDAEVPKSDEVVAEAQK